jgi:hypothetical protein
VRAPVIGKHAEAGDLQRQGPGLTAPLPAGGALERTLQLATARFIDVAQEFETQVNVLGSHPLHRQLIATPRRPQWRKRVPELLTQSLWKVQRDERSNRLPRR